MVKEKMNILPFQQKKNEVTCVIPQGVGSVWSSLFKSFQYLGMLENDSKIYSWNGDARPKSGWQQTYGPTHATQMDAPDLVIRVLADHEACRRAVENGDAAFAFTTEHSESMPVHCTQERFGNGKTPDYLLIGPALRASQPELTQTLQSWAQHERDTISPIQAVLRALCQEGTLRSNGQNRFTTAAPS